MKKFNMILVMVIMMAGCAVGQNQVQIDTESQAVIAKIAARHVGYELNKEYPDIAREVAALSEDILIAEESEIIAVIVDRTIIVLGNEFIDDPLLVMDIQDLIALVEIKADVEIAEGQMVIIKAVAKGLIDGIGRIHEEFL